MKLEKVNQQLEDNGVSYLYFSEKGKPRDSFVVCTTNFNCPYIRSLAVRPDPDSAGSIKVFSYSQNRMRSIPVKDIKRIVPLNTELKRVRSLRSVPRGH